ncbi:hypothetical protein FRC12_001466 [Ceratobasidium sp. 428]|nr:hypothetical protein FRC12_001466 [Ceratobasidium sp. 428]
MINRKGSSKLIYHLGGDSRVGNSTSVQAPVPSPHKQAVNRRLYKYVDLLEPQKYYSYLEDFATMRLSLLLVASLPLIVASNQLDPPIEDRINWRPCRGDGKDPHIQCGRFEVPLDYASDKEMGSKKAILSIARYPATREPKLGTLFLGPGGPGDSGIDTLILHDNAKIIMDIVGGQYDLVSWDPRGSGFKTNSNRKVLNTVPRADCFAFGTDEFAFWKNTIPRWGLEARGILPTPEDLDAFYAQVAPVDELLGKLGDRCLEKSGEMLKYMGTAATVRDLVSLHDYLVGGDKDINFWGFSYGTAIGIYLVNSAVFKERVGRVVLDGVVDPIYYANMPAHETWAIDAESSDLVMSGFLKECIEAGPDKCAFTSSGSTRWDLETKVDDLIIRAYDYKVKMGKKAGFGSAHIRDALFRGMYTPKSWRVLAQRLEACWKWLNGGNATPPEGGCKALISGQDEKPRAARLNEPPAYGLQAVTCADAIDAGGVTTQTVFEMMGNMTKINPLFGPRWGAAGFYCHKWPVRAVERYTGPWDNTLKNKIVVIGNEFDPITPFRSAESVAAALGDSALLIEQKNYGHTSLAMHSECTFDILHGYFLNGKLPSSKQVCATNQPIFEDEPESTPIPPAEYLLSDGKGAIGALWKPLKTPLAPALTSCFFLVVFVLFRVIARAGKDKRIAASTWKEIPAKV